MATLANVTAEQIKREIGTPERAVDLVRDLLWAESGRQGINPFRIAFSGKIYSKDGGVDGTTIDISPHKEGLLFKGSTYYQIKWGENFDPRKESHLTKELFIHGNGLKQGVEKIARQKGTYVLVWLGGRFVGTEDDDCTQMIKKIFIDKGYSEINVFLLDQGKIAQSCSQHPVIQSVYFNLLTEYFLTLDQWRGRFVSGKEKNDQEGEVISVSPSGDVQRLRDAVDEPPYTPVQLLSCGDKKRHQDNRWLVYRALRNDGLTQKTICIDASDFRPPLSTTLESRLDLNQVIVVDNCTEKHHEQLVDRLLGERTSRLALVILSTDEVSIDDERFALIGRRGLTNSKFLKEIARRKPNEAVLAVSEIKHTGVPDQEILDLPELAKSFYADTVHRHGHETLIHIQRVLRFIALFSKVGSEVNITPELRFLSRKIGFVETSDWLVFAEIVYILRTYRIIEGKYYVTVSDKKFRQFLIQEWWSIYGFMVDFELFLKDIYIFSEDLARRLIESMPYITATKSGKGVAKALLGESGIFSQGHLLKDRFGSRLFGKLTEADPREALSCLKRSVGTWSRNELLEFRTGRREVVWALEKIAMWKDLFVHAARLLLALGEAENETWSNNACGVFAELFSSGRGPVAPTEASPQERLPVLKEALGSSSEERRVLALRACDQALESEHFVRTVGAEHQGLRKEPQLWMPKTYGELFDAYRQVWQLLLEKLDSLPENEQKQAADILLQRARGLVRIQNLADMVIDTVKELVERPYGGKKKILAHVVQILHYEGKDLPPRTRQRWEQLKDKLTGSDFSSLMKRYVGMDLLEDEFDEKGKHVDQAQARIEELAQKTVENRDLLQPELAWLVTTEAENGYRFGYELGKRDIDFSFLPLLLKAQQNAGANGTVYFLGAYFGALFEKNQNKWEDELDALAGDKKLNACVPELTFRSGMSDRAALRILNLAIEGLIDLDQFRMFVWGHAIKKLSEGVFKKLIHCLLGSSNTDPIFIALDLYYLYYVYGKSKHTLPEQLTLRLLTHQLLWQKCEASRRSHREDYHWTGIGKAFVNRYPKKSLELANKILEHFGEQGTIVGGFHSRTHTVLNEITRQYPKQIWMRISEYLGPPVDSRGFHIRGWLRGGQYYEEKDGALLFMPPEKIWKWVDEDVEKRAWYLASFVPKVLLREHGKLCFAREILVRYGTRKDVRQSLIANFSTESWTGPGSLHHQKKKQQLFDFREEEDDENVKRWIDDYVSSLDWEIEREKSEEEKEGF